MTDIPNIKFLKANKNPTIDSDNSLYLIPFYKDDEYFANLDNFVSFIKATENLVRTSKFYQRYISYIKDDVGLTCCQVLSNLQPSSDEDFLKIEMHHGPILTLFDYISIVVDYMLAKDKKGITTYAVANTVLDEHFLNNVQVVMLSKTVHEEVHENNIFINTKQAFGDLNTFLEKYKDGLSDEHIKKINDYITLCEKYDSFDKDILNISNNMKTWGFV